MKKIEAIVRPGKLNTILSALEELGYPGVTITEVEGHGRQKGITAQWRGRTYTMELVPKIKLEIVAGDDEVETIVETIVNAAKTGEIGDGKIFISPIDNVVRIRTGEKGELAI
ncbi:MAG: P-II family nitrogen regulator [bacterium]|nr:P-II family nitrogen regulator [bacterium]